MMEKFCSQVFVLENIVLSIFTGFILFMSYTELVDCVGVCPVPVPDILVVLVEII